MAFKVCDVMNRIPSDGGLGDLFDEAEPLALISTTGFWKAIAASTEERSKLFGILLLIIAR